MYAKLPANYDLEDPYLLVLRDAETDELLLTLEQYEYGLAVFMGAPWHGEDAPRFSARAGRTYVAEVLFRPPDMMRLKADVAPVVANLPVTSGISGTLTLPPVDRGGGNLIVRVGPTPPSGIPVASPESKYYMDVVAHGVVVYSGEIKLHLLLPRQLANGRFHIAYYDNGRWRLGWRIYSKLVSATRGSLSLDVPIRNLILGYRRYSLALVPEQATVAPAPDDNKTRGIVAIVGDSLASLTAFPDDRPDACELRVGPLPTCQYTNDTSVTFPSLVARRTGRPVINLSWPAIELGGDRVGDSAISLEIPQIPHNANYVVLEAGAMDVDLRSSDDRTAVLLEATSEIVKRAPHAKIIYVGLRYILKTATDEKRKSRVDAWNALARELAAKRGTYLDTVSLFPPGRSSYSPDGLHLSISGHEVLADAITRVISPMVP